MLSEKLQRAYRFSIVGATTNLLVYLVFLLLLNVGASPLIAAGICYLIGVALSYILNRRWTFSSSNTHNKDLPRFLLAYAVGIFSTLLNIKILMIWLPPEHAQIINIGCTATVIYFMLNFVKFGENNR